MVGARDAISLERSTGRWRRRSVRRGGSSGGKRRPAARAGVVAADFSTQQLQRGHRRGFNGTLGIVTASVCTDEDENIDDDFDERAHAMTMHRSQGSEYPPW